VGISLREDWLWRCKKKRRGRRIGGENSKGIRERKEGGGERLEKGNEEKGK